MSEAEERLGNDPTSELWGEHRARYHFAAQFASGRRVLDIACGSGFGLQMMSEVGADAIGMDLDFRALCSARVFGAPVVQSDAAQLPLPDRSVALITSFETIEHVPDATVFVQELKRVLEPGGRLVLSTPNRGFGPPQRHQNPFHIQEFSVDDLRCLLSAAFANVEIYGQRPSQAYRFVPYLMLESHWTPDEIVWKALNRLPFSIKDKIAYLLNRQHFYPDEFNYTFDLERTEGAHALLAVCQ